MTINVALNAPACCKASSMEITSAGVAPTALIPLTISFKVVPLGKIKARLFFVEY